MSMLRISRRKLSGISSFQPNKMISCWRNQNTYQQKIVNHQLYKYHVNYHNIFAARRPSFTRVPSFSLSDDNGLNRNTSTDKEENPSCTSNVDGKLCDWFVQPKDPVKKTYPSERQKKVQPEIEAQDQFLLEHHGLLRYIPVQFRFIVKLQNIYEIKSFLIRTQNTPFSFASFYIICVASYL